MSRTCANDEKCVVYAQLGEPGKLSRYNGKDVCEACGQRRLDAEDSSRAPSDPPQTSRKRRTEDGGSISAERKGSLPTGAPTRETAATSPRSSRQSLERPTPALRAPTTERDGVGTEGTVVSVGEAARMLGVHRNTVIRRIRTKQLPAEKRVVGGREEYRIPLENLLLSDRRLVVARVVQSRHFLEELSRRLVDDLRITRGEPGGLWEAYGEAREELGREKARREFAEREVEVLRAEVSAMRERLEG